MKEENLHIVVRLFGTLMIFSRIFVQWNPSGLTTLDNTVIDLLGALILYSGILITVPLHKNTKQYNRCLMMADEQYRQMDACYELAKIYILTRQDFAALRYYKRAFDIAEQIGDYDSKYKFYSLLDNTAREITVEESGHNLLLRIKKAFEERNYEPVYTKGYLDEIQKQRKLEFSPWNIFSEAQMLVNLLRRAWNLPFQANNLIPIDNFYYLGKEEVIQEDLLLMINVFKALDQHHNVVCCGLKYIHGYLNDVRNVLTKMRVCLVIAGGLYQMSKYDDVILYCNKCILLGGTLNCHNNFCYFTQMKARILDKMALGWRSLYNSEKNAAFSHTRHAVKIARKSKRLLIETFLKQAEFLKMINEHRAAVDLLSKKALPKAQVLNEKTAILRIHLYLTECYLSLNQEKEASSSLKDYFTALNYAENAGCTQVAFCALFQSYDNTSDGKDSRNALTERGQNIERKTDENTQSIIFRIARNIKWAIVPSKDASKNIMPYLSEMLSNNICLAQKFITRLCIHTRDIEPNNWKILEDLCDFLKKRVQSTSYSENHNAIELSLVGAIEYASNENDSALESLKKSVHSLDKSMNCINVDGYQIASADRYIDSCKLIFKLLINKKRFEEAVITGEQCRSKVLNSRLLSKHLAQNKKCNETEYEKIESFIQEQKCTILFFVWCFEDLYIFVLKYTVNENGEHLVRQKMHSASNCRQNFDLEVMKLLEEMDGFFDQTTCKVRTNDIIRPASENEECICNTENKVNCERCSIQRLSGMLFETIINDGDTDELIIIPEGSLNLLPFAALQDPTTMRFLSQDKRLRYSPSITTLLIHQTVPDDYYARSGSLIVGNPSVDQIEGMESLPGSKKEAETIALIIDGVMPLIGSRATKTAVLERLCDVCIAHFACHIKLNPSAIVLSPEGPLQDDDDSYLLKPEDVMEKDIHARLVVLSGCNSGLGKICAEGVVGIARAFLAAGVAAVLVSLWRVGDHSTCEFMTTFYKYFLDWKVRRGASESLHLTINTMRTRYPNEPEKWSGFYLMGDDVTIDRESLSVLPEPELPEQPVSSGREPCENNE